MLYILLIHFTELILLYSSSRHNNCLFVSRRANGDTSPVKPMQSGETDSALNISVDELSRIDASSTRSTPREQHASFTSSEGSLSEPSSGGGGSFEGSEMSGSLELDDDSDDNF